MAATAAIPVPQSPPRQSWTDALLQDLQPTPGRLASTLRIVLASVIALLLMEALQMPFISIGMYFIFLIGRDSPAVSLRTALFSLCIVLFAVAVELGVVILSDNDPIARLLSVAVVTFISGMIVVVDQPARAWLQLRPHLLHGHQPVGGARTRGPPGQKLALSGRNVPHRSRQRRRGRVPLRRSKSRREAAGTTPHPLRRAHHSLPSLRRECSPGASASKPHRMSRVSPSPDRPA